MQLTPAFPGIPHSQIMRFADPSVLVAGRAKNA
jgi:hypothetical protein